VKYQKILDTVIDFADKGLFDDVFWYIKDFNNYGLFLCIQDNSGKMAGSYDLDSNLNTEIAKINSQGLTDCFDNLHPLVVTKSFRPDGQRTNRGNQKYYNCNYELDHIRYNNTMSVDQIYGRKIDEAVLLLLMRHPLFSEHSHLNKFHSIRDNRFIQSLQPFLLSDNEDDDMGMYYNYDFYIMSSISNGRGIDYNCFFNMDGEETDTLVSIIPNAREDQYLEEMKQFLGNDLELMSRAYFLEDIEIVSLRVTEQMFIKDRLISKDIVADYHKIMEACAAKYWSLLASEVLDYLDIWEDQDNKSYSDLLKRNVQLKSIVSHKNKYKMLTIPAIREFNNLLLTIHHESNTAIIDKSLVQILEKEDEIFLILSGTSKVRHIVQHTFEKPDDNLLASAASAYRYVIIKLSDMIDSLS
jgi:hypothetical protein